MKQLAPIFNKEKPPGIYRISSRNRPDALLEAVADHGWQGFYINGAHIVDKASFINQFASALSFPDYHGKNWDAFEDCITDMAWLPAKGYVLVYDNIRQFARGNSKDWQTACSILRDAASYWEGKGKPMFTLFRRYWWTAWDIEKL